MPTSRLAIAAVAAALAACSGGASAVPQQAQGLVRTLQLHASSSKIQHIVIIVQENRSFNDLFYGFPGAHTSKYGYASNGDKVELQPIGLETTWISSTTPTDSSLPAMAPGVTLAPIAG